MARDVSGVYTQPAGTSAVSGQSISSSAFNQLVSDIVADLNLARPVVAGGTGASSAAGARTALGAASATDMTTALEGAAKPGFVNMFAGTTAPTGWLFCYGQAVSRTSFAALFAAISTTYGPGDGSTTFNLPDLRGRVVAGQDDMGGTSANRLTGLSSGIEGDTLGAYGGAETHTLTEAQLPAHTHSVTGTAASSGSHTHLIGGSGVGSGTSGNNTFVFGGGKAADITSASDGAHTHSVTGTAASVGSGAAHNNVQPTLILNYIIKT